MVPQTKPHITVSGDASYISITVNGMCYINFWILSVANSRAR